MNRPALANIKLNRYSFYKLLDLSPFLYVHLDMKIKAKQGEPHRRPSVLVLEYGRQVKAGWRVVPSSSALGTGCYKIATSFNMIVCCIRMQIDVDESIYELAKIIQYRY